MSQMETLPAQRVRNILDMARPLERKEKEQERKMEQERKEKEQEPERKEQEAPPVRREGAVHSPDERAGWAL